MLVLFHGLPADILVPLQARNHPREVWAKNTVDHRFKWDILYIECFDDEAEWLEFVAEVKAYAEDNQINLDFFSLE